MISSFCLQQCIECVLNLPLNERQCLVQAKQGVYAIINHNNFCGGEKKKKSNYKPCLYTGDPREGCAEFAPLDKKS